MSAVLLAVPDDPRRRRFVVHSSAHPRASAALSIRPNTAPTCSLVQSAANVARFVALAARADVKLHGLTLRQRLAALTLQVRDVHEHVLASIA